MLQMAEYDFPAEEIDEKVAVLTVPKALNQSLNVSRFKD